jgi:hypothetical protein
MKAKPADLTQEEVVEAGHLLRALLNFVDAYIPKAARQKKAMQLARSRRVADKIIAANEKLDQSGKTITLRVELDPLIALAGTVIFVMSTEPGAMGEELQPFVDAVEFLVRQGLMEREVVCEGSKTIH